LWERLIAYNRKKLVLNRFVDIKSVYSKDQLAIGTLGQARWAATKIRELDWWWVNG